MRGIHYFSKSPLHYHSHHAAKREKSKDNAGSTYFKIKVSRPRSYEDAIDKSKAMYGVISFKKKAPHEYIVEFDNHGNSTPHFHLWRVNGSSKMSDTRSAGISLKTSINRGVIHTIKERKNELRLNDVQSEEMVLFVEENRPVLLAMYEAFRSGKIKDFTDMDESQILSVFNPNERDMLIRQYSKLVDEQAPDKIYE